jgi:hypothetical protein
MTDRGGNISPVGTAFPRPPQHPTNGCQQAGLQFGKGRGSLLANVELIYHF